MTANGWIQIGLYVVVLTALTPVLGAYMARVYQGESVVLSRVLGPIERLTYRALRTDPAREQDWKGYAKTTIVFSALFWVVLYVILRVQRVDVFNPTGFHAAPWDVTFNTTSSFITNTNWQYYSGETTLTYLSQMAGLAVQNFVSAGVGMAVLAAVIRGFARRNADTLGNFWVDLTRTLLYILVPLAFIGALILVAGGVVQTLAGPASFTTALGGEQTIALGPAASQIAIKQLGTNGGGFFNVNSAHPFENPTPFSDFLEMLSILLIAAALCYTFGKMVGDTRQGWALLAAMTIIFVAFLSLAVWAESSPNPAIVKLGVDQAASDVQGGGNMEGKEVRFGIANSALWATATTSASNGSVNSMHDSYMPLGGLVTLVMIHLGEVIYGGVGSGLYGMLAFVIVAVFVAGLMVGRTPEYLGKKIETYEIKMAAVLILIMPLIVLGFTALGVVTDAGKAGIANPGPHGFSEILYAFTSMGNNNGSAFAGLTVNTPFYNILGGIAMLISRYWLALPTLALAGSLVRKKRVPESAGTLPTHSPLFIGWVVAVVIIVAGLNFIPALALGPIVEHLIMISGG